jgi:hypothetical protein
MTSQYATNFVPVDGSYADIKLPRTQSRRRSRVIQPDLPLPSSAQSESFSVIPGDFASYLREPVPSANTNDPYIPKTLLDLDSNEETSSILLSITEAVRLQIPFLSLENEGKKSVLIQEYSKYREVSQINSKLRYGIAIRWIISIVELDVKARIDQANMIAASAEFGYVKTNAKFQVIGMQSQEITDLIPNPDDLTVDQYALFASSLTAIKKLISKRTTTIRPKLLASPRELISELDRYTS